MEDETVWLTQAQIASLLGTTSQNITMHLKNIFSEGELAEISTCKDFLQVRKEGGREVSRKTKHYNLDAVISVGYRIKSSVATKFRIWATQVLKNYLLKGYVVNRRIDRVEDKVADLSAEVQEIKLQLNTSLPQTQGIFYDGQIFDAYAFVCDLVKTATQEIVLIDNYIDESVLQLLSKRQKGVKVLIYTMKNSKTLQQDIEKYTAQYGKIALKKFTKSHDRFLIIDKTVYHFGASLKDIGKKWFAFSKMQIDKNEIEKQLNN